MNFGRPHKNNIFIIFFIVAAISFFSLADILVPKDVVAAAEKQSCVTSKCHANMGKGEYVHGPVSVLQCIICHVPTAEHAFKPIENVGKLCNQCHDKKFTGKVAHPPEKGRKCTGCHDPHQSPNQFMLRDKGS